VNPVGLQVPGHIRTINETNATCPFNKKLKNQKEFEFIPLPTELTSKYHLHSNSTKCHKLGTLLLVGMIFP